MVTTKLELHPGCSGKQGGGHLSLEAWDLEEKIVSELCPEEGIVIIANTFVAFNFWALVSSFVQ